eukprot:g1071.t1
MDGEEDKATAGRKSRDKKKKNKKNKKRKKKKRKKKDKKYKKDKDGNYIPPDVVVAERAAHHMHIVLDQEEVYSVLNDIVSTVTWLCDGGPTEEQKAEACKKEYLNLVRAEVSTSERVAAERSAVVEGMIMHELQRAESESIDKMTNIWAAKGEVRHLRNAVAKLVSVANDQGVDSFEDGRAEVRRLRKQLRKMNAAAHGIPFVEDENAVVFDGTESLNDVKAAVQGAEEHKQHGKTDMSDDDSTTKANAKKKNKNNKKKESKKKKNKKKKKKKKKSKEGKVSLDDGDASNDEGGQGNSPENSSGSLQVVAKKMFVLEDFPNPSPLELEVKARIKGALQAELQRSEVRPFHISAEETTLEAAQGEVSRLRKVMHNIVGTAGQVTSEILGDGVATRRIEEEVGMCLSAIVESFVRYEEEQARAREEAERRRYRSSLRVFAEHEVYVQIRDTAEQHGREALAIIRTELSRTPFELEDELPEEIQLAGARGEIVRLRAVLRSIHTCTNFGLAAVEPFEHAFQDMFYDAEDAMAGEVVEKLKPPIDAIEAELATTVPSLEEQFEDKQARWQVEWRLRDANAVLREAVERQDAIKERNRRIMEEKQLVEAKKHDLAVDLGQIEEKQEFDEIWYEITRLRYALQQFRTTPLDFDKPEMQPLPEPPQWTQAREEHEAYWAEQYEGYEQQGEYSYTEDSAGSEMQQ